MKAVAIGALTVVSGCAMTATGLERSAVEMTITSQKSAQQFATCSAEAMLGNNDLRNDGDHYWILRMNGYNMPTVRWDFTNQPGGGSKAELRASISVNTGDERVRNCA